MTTDIQLAPTDDEIVALMGDPRYSTIGAVREAISRWGRSAHRGEPVAWRSAVLDLIDDCPGLTMEQDHWLSRRIKELDFPSAPRPAPSAAVALSDDLRDRLVAISEAIADQDDRAAQAMLRAILKAPQADSQPAPVHQWDTGYPPLPMQFACSGMFPVYSADQMRAFADATCALRATPAQFARGFEAAKAQFASHGQAPAPINLNCKSEQKRLATLWGFVPAQAAPAAVAGPSGYGPKVTVKRRCSDCKACNSESYAVQGDSGHYVYCEHPSLPERKYIGDTHWDTPDWCPAAAPTTQPAPNGDEGISREQWIEQAMRVYLIAGDTEQQAEECAKYLWGELDMDDLADPYDAAMSDVEGRGPAPQQEAQEPVAGHCRFPGTVWSECSPEHVRMVLANPDDWKGYEVRYLYTAPQPAPQQEAQEPVKLSDEQIKAHGDKASRMMARDLTRFDAACEVDKYLREQGAPGYYRHRMSIVLFGNVEGTGAARAPDTAPQPSPAAQGDALDAARYRLLRDGEWDDATHIYDALMNCPGSADDLDAAIDAARATQEGK